jgi:carbamoyl-phosphate synthase large subunit
LSSMRHRQVNVLFTSIGRRVELVRAFQRAYSVLGLKGKIIGLDVDPLAPGLQIVDKPYIVPNVASEDYVSTLQNICRRQEVGLVFPLIDPDIRVLARARPVLEAAGAKVAVVSEAAAATTGDKWPTYRFFRALGIATPRTWLPEQLADADLTYPLFIKPRTGSAGKSAFRVTNCRELEFFLDYVPKPIIQECINGPEITSDVLCDFDGSLLGVVSRRRIEVRSGEVAKGVTVYREAVIDACARIARALPGVGPITVQCLMDGDTPRFTEINARFGGGVPLAIAAGLDLPLLLLSRCTSRPVAAPALGAYQTNLHIVRFDDSYFLTAQGRAQMAACELDTQRVPMS